MGRFSLIRPRDDAAAQQASDWGNDLIKKYASHTLAGDLYGTTQADQSNILAALAATTDLICYFGHGQDDAWLTSNAATADTSNISAANGKAVVSVACKTSCSFAPAAITGGVTSWLGFAVRIPVVAPYKTADPFGDAIVDGLALLGNGDTMQQARDRISANCDQLVTDFDSGWLNAHPAAELGYFAAMSLRDQVVLHGSTALTPLL